MAEKTTPETGAEAPVKKPRFRVPPVGDVIMGGVGGVLLGQGCHNGVMTEIYADFDETGQVVALHPIDVGSC